MFKVNNQFTRALSHISMRHAHVYTHRIARMHTLLHAQISDLLLNSVAITNVLLVATYGKLCFHVLTQKL